MRRIDVQFVRRPPPGRLAWSLPAVLLLAALGTAGWAWRLNAQAEALRAQAREQAQREEALARDAALRAVRPVAAPPPYAADAQAALKLQRMPLNAALASLEAVGAVGVLPVSVDISAADATVRVQVEFSNYEALLKYLEDLNAGEPVERWRLSTAQGSGGQATGGRPTALIISRW